MEMTYEGKDFKEEDAILFSNDESSWIEEISFLEACMECDDDALYNVIQDGVTREEVNETDNSGRTGLSHACSNGFLPVVEMLAELEEVEVNYADNDGNSPLIFASQAGNEDIVAILLRTFPDIRVNQANKLGFTALMKAAIQGRTKTAKLLLFAGADPKGRDNGRGLSASEWARFCGRHSCADDIERYVRSTKYFIAKTFFIRKERCNSDSDLLDAECFKKTNGKSKRGSAVASKGDQGNVDDKLVGLRDDKRSGSLGWINRHLSMKRKQLPRNEKRPSLSLFLELRLAAVAGSVPMLFRSASNLTENETEEGDDKESKPQPQVMHTLCRSLNINRDVLTNVNSSQKTFHLPAIHVTAGD